MTKLWVTGQAAKDEFMKEYFKMDWDGYSEKPTGTPAHGVSLVTVPRVLGYQLEPNQSVWSGFAPRLQGVDG